MKFSTPMGPRKQAKDLRKGSSWKLSFSTAVNIYTHILLNQLFLQFSVPPWNLIHVDFLWKSIQAEDSCEDSEISEPHVLREAGSSSWCQTFAENPGE